MSKYNGWANRSTWLVNLWIDNEESTYRYRMERLAGRHIPVTAAWAREVGTFFLTVSVAAPGFASDGGNLDEVDWEEIAEHWESDRLEAIEYAN